MIKFKENLEVLCKSKSYNSWNPINNPESTPRNIFIQELLSGYNFIIDKFNSKFTSDKIENTAYLNYYIYCNNFDNAKHTIIFTAHHDTVGCGDNVFDNLASVYNLINIIPKINNDNYNVIVVLLDAEEIVSFTHSGSKRLSNKINSDFFGKVEIVINLELTALGNIIWSTKSNDKFKFSNVVHTPFNDSTVIQSNGINTLCIGLFDSKSYDEYFESASCSIWRYCHNSEDNLSKVNYNDMKNFQEYLIHYINKY